MLRRAPIALLAVVLLLATGWSALVLFFTGPVGAIWARASLAVVYTVASVAVIIWLRPRWLGLAVWSIGFCAILALWNALPPSNDRDWQPDVAGMSWAEIDADRLTFQSKAGETRSTGSNQ